MSHTVDHNTKKVPEHRPDAGSGDDAADEVGGFAAVRAKWKQGATKFGSPKGGSSSSNAGLLGSVSTHNTSTAKSTPIARSANNNRGGTGLHQPNDSTTRNTNTSAALAVPDPVPASVSTSTSLVSHNNTNNATVPSTSAAPEWSSHNLRPVRQRRASLSSAPSEDFSATPTTTAAGGGTYYPTRTRVTTTITTTTTVGGKSTVSKNSTQTWRNRPATATPAAAAATNTTSSSIITATANDNINNTINATNDDSLSKGLDLDDPNNSNVKPVTAAAKLLKSSPTSNSVASSTTTAGGKRDASTTGTSSRAPIMPFMGGKTWLHKRHASTGAAPVSSTAAATGTPLVDAGAEAAKDVHSSTPTATTDIVETVADTAATASIPSSSISSRNPWHKRATSVGSAVGNNNSNHNDTSFNNDNTAIDPTDTSNKPHSLDSSSPQKAIKARTHDSVPTTAATASTTSNRMPRATNKIDATPASLTSLRGSSDHNSSVSKEQSTASESLLMKKPTKTRSSDSLPAATITGSASTLAAMSTTGNYEMPVPTPYRTRMVDDLRSATAAPTPVVVSNNSILPTTATTTAESDTGVLKSPGRKRWQKVATANRLKQTVIYKRKEQKTASLPVFAHTDRESECIWQALYNHSVFNVLKMGELGQLVAACEPCSYAAGDIIVNEGDTVTSNETAYFYVIDRGTVEFTVQDDVHIGTATAGDTFGELSLFYSSPRACTVLALEDVRLFRCERFAFCTILSRETQRCVHQKCRIIDTVPFLANATTVSRDIPDYIIPRLTRQGDVIVEQGSTSSNDTFYVIAEGEIRCKDKSSSTETRSVLRVGDYFGERNLVVSPLEPSPATYVVSTAGILFCIKRAAFARAIGKANMEAVTQGILNDRNVRLLEEVRFLQNCTPAQLAVLASLLKEKTFSTGEAIMIEKETTKAALYLVEHGSFSMATADRGLSDKKIIKSGSCFGEAHMQRAHSKGKKSTKSQYSIWARADCTCLVLTIKDYWTVVGSPELPAVASKPQTDAIAATSQSKEQEELKPTELEVEEQDADESEAPPLESADVMILESPKSPVFETFAPTVSTSIINSDEKSAISSIVRSLPSIRPTEGKSDDSMNAVNETVESSVLTEVKPIRGVRQRRQYSTSRQYSMSRQMSLVKIDPVAFKLENLKRHCVLGEGTFGVVWLVSNTSQGNQSKYYALKKQSKSFLLDENQVEAVIQEKIMLDNMKHPFLINLFATFQDEMFVYMLLDFVQGGELFSLMHEDESPTLPESQAKFYALCLADVLAYLHKSRYVYRDLKPENVMLDGKGYVKLIDFGFCKYLVSDKTFTLVGTPGYLSPETVTAVGHSFSSDNWSLGILLYEMINGSSPFYYEDIDQMELFESIVNDPVHLSDSASADASDIILRLLEKDPLKRLGSDSLYDIVDHPWFDDLDLTAMRRREVSAPWAPDVQGPMDTSYFNDWSDLELANDVADGNYSGDMSKKGQILSKRDQKLFEGSF